MESLQVPNDISEWLELGQNVVERVGDCANLERKVNVTRRIIVPTYGSFTAD